MWQMANPSQQSREIFAIDILHRQEMYWIAINKRLSNVIYAADIGMRDITRRSNLTMKAGEYGAVIGKSRREKFERDQLMKRQILGLVDLAHAAAAEKTDNPVPVR